MQFISITNSEFSLFCPFTGDAIFSEDVREVTTPTVRGLWIDEVIDEPEIDSPALATAWQQHAESILESEDPGDALSSCLKSTHLPDHIAIHFTHNDTLTGSQTWLVLAP